MQTRSMTCKIAAEKAKEEETYYFDETEYYYFLHEHESYRKEQERRRLAGVKPVIICMGGPYSDLWYPPHN